MTKKREEERTADRRCQVFFFSFLDKGKVGD